MLGPEEISPPPRRAPGTGDQNITRQGKAWIARIGRPRPGPGPELLVSVYLGSCQGSGQALTVREEMTPEADL